MSRMLCVSLFFLSTVVLQAQSHTVQDTLLTHDDNLEWLAELAELSSLSKQVEAIKSKIWRDTHYVFHKTNYSIGCMVRPMNNVQIRSAKDKYPCDCKILFVFNQGKKRSYILDVLQFEKSREILNLITDDNIKWTILDESVAPYIYGSSARCGAVVLEPKDKKWTKYFRKNLR